LDAGTPIKEAALREGIDPLFAGLPVILMVTLGGFVTNASYCLYQNFKNNTFKEYFTITPYYWKNILFCALAGVLWYSQFFGLEMGKSFLGDSPILLAFSWSILMSLNIIFSNVWGILLKEWKGSGAKTAWVLGFGILVLVVAIFFPSF
jgi:L-rhamnose-H+ transport protein